MTEQNLFIDCWEISNEAEQSDINLLSIRSSQYRMPECAQTIVPIVTLCLFYDNVLMFIF